MATKRPMPSPGEGKPLAPSPRGAMRTAAQAHGEALPVFAFDLETTGLDPYAGAKIFAWATCTPAGEVKVYRPGRKELQALLLSSAELVCHNYHFELAMLRAEGFEIGPGIIWHDTMIMAQLFDNLQPAYDLGYQGWKWGKYPMDMDNEVSKAAKIYGTYDKIPKALMEKYQCTDVERAMLLYLAFRPKLEADPRLWADYLNEIALVDTTIEMERTGIMLCRPEADKLLNWMAGEIQHVEQEIFRIRGDYMNLSSGPQVARLLYDDLKLTEHFNIKTGSRTTDRDTLEELRPEAEKLGGRAAEVFDLILKHRSYTKGVAMVKSYKEAAGEGDIIHPHINTNRAKSGRESGENPNMQNISKEAALKTKFAVPARRCFRARPGAILFLVDYAGIEMRLIIELTKEPELVELIKNNGDPHALAASLFYRNIWADEGEACKFTGAPEIKKARKILRTASKNAQFALAYGARFPKIASVLMLPEEIAAPGHRAYCQRFPRIASFTTDSARQVKVDGFVTTSFGRRLYVPQDKPYSGSNYRIQGTAAGILKRAQNRVKPLLAGTGAEMLLPIHDELIFEWPRTLLPAVRELHPKIEYAMTTFEEIEVPLAVEWKMTTYTWDKAKEFKCT